MKTPPNNSPSNKNAGASTPRTPRTPGEKEAEAAKKIRPTLHEQMIAHDTRGHELIMKLDDAWDLKGEPVYGAGLIPLAVGQIRDPVNEQQPPTIARNLLFGLNPWVHSVFEIIIGMARCLHPPADGIFLEEKMVYNRRKPWSKPKRTLKKRKYTVHDLRDTARHRFLTVVQHNERLCGLCDSWVVILRHCLLELDSIILLCSEEMSAQTTINFGALQQMWRDFHRLMIEKVLCDSKRFSKTKSIKSRISAQ